VARLGEKRNVSRILVVKPEETGWKPSGRIMLKLMLNIQHGGVACTLGTPV
jgi:hypothetical protein